MSDENTLSVYMRDRVFYESAVDFYHGKIDELSSAHFGPFEISIGKTIGNDFCWPGEWPYFVCCECDSRWRWVRMQMFIAIFRDLWANLPEVCVAEDDNGFMPFFSTRKRFVINSVLVDQYIAQRQQVHSAIQIVSASNAANLNNVFSGVVTFMDGSLGFPDDILNE